MNDCNKFEMLPISNPIQIEIKRTNLILFCSLDLFVYHRYKSLILFINCAFLLIFYLLFCVIHSRQTISNGTQIKIFMIFLNSETFKKNILLFYDSNFSLHAVDTATVTKATVSFEDIVNKHWDEKKPINIKQCTLFKCSRYILRFISSYSFFSDAELLFYVHWILLTRYYLSEHKHTGF